MSKRNWDAHVIKWRKELHQWDVVKAEGGSSAAAAAGAAAEAEHKVVGGQ